MESILIIILFCLQLVSFFLIMLLYAKLNKFKELEKKQEQLVDEMDSALSVYLLEMKEENNRLIEELASIQKIGQAAKPAMKPVPIQPTTNKFVSPISASNIYKTNKEKQMQREEVLTPISKEEPPITSVNSQSNSQTVVQALKIQRVQSEVDETIDIKELSFEEMVLDMYRSGKTIEDIAKSLNKGKTEIELLIKFHK